MTESQHVMYYSRGQANRGQVGSDPAIAEGGGDEDHEDLTRPRFFFDNCERFVFIVPLRSYISGCTS